MKKKLVAVMGIVLAGTMLVTGCQGSSKIETEQLTISKYKGIEVEKVEKTEVTGDSIDAYIEAQLQGKTTEKEITDRAVQDADIVKANYVGKIDGVEFEGGSAQDASITIGEGRLIPGFEDSIIGHTIGETYDWNGKFPDDYGKEELNGKDVVFTITVNSISEQEVPKLNDKFVKSVSEESKTVKEYKAEVKKQLETQEEMTYKETLGGAVWQVVLKNTKVKKYPDKEVKELSEALIEQYKSAAEYYQMDYETFVSEQMGGTVEAFEEQVDTAAKSSVKQIMATDAIAEKEKIKLTDDKYEAELKKIAEAYGYEDIKTLKEAAEEKDLKEMALSNMVRDFLVQKCVQVEAKAETKTETETKEKSTK